LLVSPVSRFDIIGGKTLPYFLGAMAVEGAIAVGLVYLTRGTLGGFISILAVIPLVALFLGATFLGAMFARSFKELTFLTVTITVGLTAYAFVPAIFSDVNAIALISPLTLVVRDLQGESIAVGEFVFSTTPPLLTAMVFFGLGTGLYREEDMFDQRAVSGKVLDSLVGLIPGAGHTGVLPGRLQRIVPFDTPTLERYLSVSVVTIVLIPFIFVSQLVAIALLFALGEISIVLVLVVVAIVEEIAKSLHIYAAFEHRRFSRTSTVALALGVCSGLGFFLGEKLALLAQLVGLQNLAVGEAGLQGGVAAGGPLLLVFLLAPLVLHTVTAAISAVGASRGKRQYAIAVAVAMVVHFLYNWTVVSSVA
jgi:ABC-type Na+ efflux pump permease subunit